MRGFLAWAWSPQNVPASTLNNYDIGPSDPALGVLAAGPDDDFAWSRTFLDPDAEDIDFLGYSVDYHGSGYVVGAPFETWEEIARAPSSYSGRTSRCG